MGSDDLIDGRVSLGQSKKAINALLQYVRKEQRRTDDTELLPAKEQHVWLVLTVKRMQPNKTLKPHKVPLAHPLVDPRTSAVCLITKDPQREYKDLLEAHNIKFISRVVGIQKLRGKFKGFDARRLLLRENDLFLADERVLPLLPGLLGKKWFEAKKQPIPVSLTKKTLKAELEKAVSSTCMHQNRGTCTSIKIATTSHEESQVLENLAAALPAVVAHIHGGWDNVQSFNVKTSASVSLPIWTCPLGSSQPGSRWEGMGVKEDEWTGFDAGANDDGAGGAEDIVEAEPVKETPHTNGKKRAAKTEKSEETPGGTKKKAKETQEAPKTSGKKRAAEVEEIWVGTKKVKKAKASVDATLTSGSDAKTTKLRAGAAKDEPTSKRSHKVVTKPSAPIEADPTRPPQKKAKKTQPQRSPPTPALKKSTTRAELAEKKGSLEGAQLAKKKGALRDTKKSARKGVKAELVGRARA